LVSTDAQFQAGQCRPQRTAAPRWVAPFLHVPMPSAGQRCSRGCSSNGWPHPLKNMRHWLIVERTFCNFLPISCTFHQTRQTKTNLAPCELEGVFRAPSQKHLYGTNILRPIFAPRGTKSATSCDELAKRTTDRSLRLVRRQTKSEPRPKTCSS